MKTVVSFIAGFISALALAAGAATVTITTTGAQDARLGPAFGAKLGLTDAQGNPRNATVAEVKAWIITELQAVVRNYEYEQQQKAISTQSFDPS